MPFFSIIIPVFNVEHYITECVDSVLKQNNSDCEIIIVDDGSTDRSGKIIDQYYRRYNNVIIIHKKNGGLSDARNTGIKIAKGRYLLFIDGDDYIANGALECIKEECYSQGLPDMIFLNAFKLFENKKLERLDSKLDISCILNKGKKEVLSYIAKQKKYPGSACTKLVANSIIKKNKLMFMIGKKSEDLDWSKKLMFCCNTFGYIDCHYYYYRQFRKGSISNSFNYSNFKDITAVLDGWIIEANELDDEIRNILLSFAAYEYKILLAKYCLLNKNNKTEAMKWLEKNRKLLCYRKDIHTIVIKFFVTLFGLRFTSVCLNNALKAKNILYNP